MHISGFQYSSKGNLRYGDGPLGCASRLDSNQSAQLQQELCGRRGLVVVFFGKFRFFVVSICDLVHEFKKIHGLY